MSERTAVYRLYDDDDRLLYVGISKHPELRWGQHSTTAPWWHEVVRRRIVWHGSREDARAEEIACIRFAMPLYNSNDRLAPTARTGWQLTLGGGGGDRHKNPGMTVRPPAEAKTAAQAVLDEHGLQLKAFVTACLLALTDKPEEMLQLLMRYWPPQEPVGRPRKDATR